MVSSLSNLIKWGCFSLAIKELNICLLPQKEKKKKKKKHLSAVAF